MSSELYEHLRGPGELDENFINRAYELIIKDEPELKSFINNFIVLGSDGAKSGAFSRDTKVICVFEDTIKESPMLTNKKLQALETIRHEIEHARNLQRLFERRSDIESTVIKLALKDYAIEKGLDYPDPFSNADYSRLSSLGRIDDNYVLNPEERIARIRAWKFIVNLIKNQRITQDLLEARTNLYYSYILGYKSNGWYLNPPTYEFLLNMGMYHEYYLFKKVVEKSEYCFDTRLLYGLPLIDGKEHDAKILQKVRLQKSKRP